MQAQQQARLQHRALQRFVGGRTFQHVGEAQPQIGFLDHVEQAGHRPDRIEFGLERRQVGRIGLRIQWCQRDPAAALGADSDVAVFLQPAIEGVQRFAHLGLQLGDEAICVEREIQRLVVFVAVHLEIGGQVFSGLR